MPRLHRGVVAWLYRLPELKLFNLSHPPVLETIFYLLRITDSIPFPAHKINFRSDLTPCLTARNEPMSKPAVAEPCASEGGERISRDHVI